MLASSPVLVGRSRVTFRDYMPGDYSLLHDDTRAPDNNILSVNYWLPATGWKSIWGGNFIWCGAVGNRVSHLVVPVEFNQASIFIPRQNSSSGSTLHGVELVKDVHDPSSHHRFSFTQFVTMPDAESWKRHQTFLARKLLIHHQSVSSKLPSRYEL
eukprot:gnl/TRDRNA2_/TRDRNA2_77439_c0_seq2.p1 gnl/TRDRNA2_/TRDRNA2_77439_c0~~gnl/TRDRNA2_/TRDRNA2_77439_c0_seq2.p1  ORF type:complete len:156 (+),score=4.77 gnl/TRDRNA2_/TRDRNA2_77439_c0_seq2:3-470(+)